VTQWSLLHRAHEEAVTTAGAARNALVLRYAPAVRSYVGALVKDPQDADEVAQELVVRLLRGDFGGATPERGRFRDLLRTAVRNQVRTYYTRKGRRAGVPLDVDAFAADTPDLTEEEDLRSWRESVLKLAWGGLEEYQRTHSGSVAFTVLRLRADHADDDSDALAARLADALGRPVKAEALRQQLRRARVRFAHLLLGEISRTLDDPTPEQIQEELRDLGLSGYVRDLVPEGG
jgi:RNA polymerase sigma-70 factor (ECF subfamily)